MKLILATKILESCKTNVQSFKIKSGDTIISDLIYIGVDFYDSRLLHFRNKETKFSITVNLIDIISFNDELCYIVLKGGVIK